MQVHKRLTEDPPSPRTLNRFLPRDLCTICLKCLERDPNRRYSTAKELAEELGRFIRHEPILARPISRTERVLRWAKRKPAVAAAAVLTVCLAIGGPITAMVIESQRQRLGELVAEKDSIIERNAADKQKDANEISKLSASLALWEGRANPSKLWPPTPAERPRTILMERIVPEGKSFTSPWAQTADEQQQAFGHLALAIMNDELERGKEAVTHYQAARELLTDLAASDPTALQYSVALADCLLQLGRLRVEADRAGAEKDIEQAQAINRQLAKQHDDPRLQAGWLEAELQMAVMLGFEGATENLKLAQQISTGFGQNVPKDPVELYQLACYLGGREPILMTRQADNDAK
jgi:serine/threonine-protein kinase